MSGIHTPISVETGYGSSKYLRDCQLLPSEHHSLGLDLLIPHSNHLPIILHGDDVDSSREDIVKSQSTSLKAGLDIEDGALLFSRNLMSVHPLDAEASGFDCHS